MLLNCGVGEDSWESLGLQGDKPVNPKGNQPWMFIGKTNAEAETPILWPPHVKNGFIGKDPDAGKDWRQEEKGTTEDEMVGWHHQLNGKSLSKFQSWWLTELDMTEWLNWTDEDTDERYWWIIEYIAGKKWGAKTGLWANTEKTGKTSLIIVKFGGALKMILKFRTKFFTTSFASRSYREEPSLMLGLCITIIFYSSLSYFPPPAAAAAAAAASLQSCPTLCDPIDGSPPGSPVPGVLQVRTLEWVAISFSNAWKWKVKGKSLSRVRLFMTPWTAAYQAPPSMGFSRQECWSGVPPPTPSVFSLSVFKTTSIVKTVFFLQYKCD